jgi:hypothetical protein
MIGLDLYHKGFKTCIYPKHKKSYWVTILQYNPEYIIWNYENREGFFLTTKEGRVLTKDDIYSLVNDGCFADGYQCEGWIENRWVRNDL